MKKTFLISESIESIYLIGVGPGDAYRVEQVFKAMRDRPEIQSHLVGHQSVCVIKQVDVPPGQGTMLLQPKGQRETTIFSGL